jgi:hypothetical protein
MWPQHLYQGKIAALCAYCTDQGSIFRSENYIYSPSLLKMIFSPFRDKSFILLPSWHFCIISSLFCIYFTLLLPLFSFSFTFLPILSPFFLCLLHFHPFSHSPFHIFPPNDLGCYSPLPLRGERGYFPVYRPLVQPEHCGGMVLTFHRKSSSVLFDQPTRHCVA